MLDADKLQEMHDHHEMSEEEFVVQKKRLANKTLHRDENKTGKNGIIYIILAFFLGALGLHNFYAGYWGRGLAQLFLTLVAPWFLYIPLLFVAIWVLLELLFVNKGPHGIPFTGNKIVIISLRIAAVVMLAMAFSYTSLVIDEPGFEEVVVQV